VGWGNNYSGLENIPAGLSNVTCVALGMNDEAAFGVALMADNTAVSWGSGMTNSGEWPDYGQAIVPSGLSNVVSLSSGAYHCVALKNDGNVVSWGWISEVPTGLSNVIAVAAGGIHNLALKSDGTIVAWGENWAGQTNVPVGLGNVTQIAAGESHSLAVKNDGTVVGWGDSAYGQASIPSGLSNVVQVAAGLWHSIALRSDGTVTGWGDDRSGQATPPAGLSNVVSIAAGRFHCLAVKNDGVVVGWGSDNGGGKTPPPGLSNVVTIVAGARDSAAISVDLMAELSLNEGSPVVRFQTFSGQNYSVQFSPSLTTTNWTQVPGGSVTGNGYMASIADTNALLSAPARFYRISRLP
jgi:alpha-tubulin suppressor-like RCC1 family protein